MRALNQAFDFFKQHNIDTHNMIHHSDRGVQYASARYTDLLRAQDCRISMTQTGDPLHNALAERMNNTLKNSWYISSEEQTFEEATQAVARAVEMYNTARPHQSLGGKTPLQLLVPDAPNPLIPTGGGSGGAAVPLGEGDASGGREPSWCISPKLYAKMNPKQRAIFAPCKRSL